MAKKGKSGENVACNAKKLGRQRCAGTTTMSVYITWSQLSRIIYFGEFFESKHCNHHNHKHIYVAISGILNVCNIEKWWYKYTLSLADKGHDIQGSLVKLY